MRDKIYNGGAYCRSALLAINKTATAAGAGDATKVDSAWVDRKGSKGLAMSAKLVIAYTATLAANQSLTFAANFRDATSIGGAGAAVFSDLIPATVAAASTPGGTLTGTVEIDVDLGHAREFIQAQVTPDLSAGATDTCEWAAVLLFFGDHNQPVSQAIASIGGVN